MHTEDKVLFGFVGVSFLILFMIAGVSTHIEYKKLNILEQAVKNGVQINLKDLK